MSGRNHGHLHRHRRMRPDNVNHLYLHHHRYHTACCAGGADGTAECTGSNPQLNAAYIAWRNNFAGVTTTDICGNATMSYTEGTWTSTGCNDVTTVTFTGTDECGLTTSTTFTFTITDTTPPADRRWCRRNSRMYRIVPTPQRCVHRLEKQLRWRDHYRYLWQCHHELYRR